MLTEDCNFRCKYCYQKRDSQYMNWKTARQSLDFLSPIMKKNTRIIFSGGEPFLAFSLMKKTVSYLKSKNGREVKPGKFAATTNGSLINDEVLDFLDQNRFRIDLSFDGLAQNRARQKNSFAKTVAVIKKTVERKHISFGTNSTFTPAAVMSICKSIECIIGLSVRIISLSLDLTKRWNRPSLRKLAGEISGLRELTLRHFRKTGSIPVTLFRADNQKGIWQCQAGSNLLAVTPSGEIWGCPTFYEYFKGESSTPAYREFYFGKSVEFKQDFRKKYRKISSHYRRFKMDNFYTTHSRCFLCPLIEKCGVCPVLRKPSNHPLLFVPSYICEINKILINERENFAGELKTG